MARIFSPCLVGVLALQHDLDAVGLGGLGRHVDPALVLHVLVPLNTKKKTWRNLSNQNG